MSMVSLVCFLLVQTQANGKTCARNGLVILVSTRSGSGNLWLKVQPFTILQNVLTIERVGEFAIMFP